MITLYFQILPSFLCVRGWIGKIMIPSPEVDMGSSGDYAPVMRSHKNLSGATEASWGSLYTFEKPKSYYFSELFGQLNNICECPLNKKALLKCCDPSVSSLQKQSAGWVLGSWSNSPKPLTVPCYEASPHPVIPDNPVGGPSLISVRTSIPQSPSTSLLSLSINVCAWGNLTKWSQNL